MSNHSEPVSLTFNGQTVCARLQL